VIAARERLREARVSVTVNVESTVAAREDAAQALGALRELGELRALRALGELREL